MGSCYSVDHVAEDHVHTVMATFISEEHQQKYHFGTVSNRLLWGIKHALLDPNPRPWLLQWFETFGPHEGFLTHQRINERYKQITNKTYNESEMRTGNNVLWHLGFETTPLKYRSKGKTPVEPRMTKQQPILSPPQET